MEIQLNKSISKTAKPIVILLVESNPDCSQKIKDTLLNNAMHKLYLTYNEKDSVDFLYQRNMFCKVPLPDIILLDYNHPNNGGNKILNKIWNDNKLNRIPVVIFTTLDTEQEVSIPGMNNNTGYSLKLLTFEELLGTIKTIGDFLHLIVKK